MLCRLVLEEKGFLRLCFVSPLQQKLPGPPSHNTSSSKCGVYGSELREGPRTCHVLTTTAKNLRWLLDACAKHGELWFRFKRSLSRYLLVFLPRATVGLVSRAFASGGAKVTGRTLCLSFLPSHSHQVAFLVCGRSGPKASELPDCCSQNVCVDASKHEPSR